GGDGDAAQGDGEVGVVGLETTMRGTLRLTLHKGRSIQGPQFDTPGALTPRVDGAGFHGSAAAGPDLYGAAQEAVRGMLEYLQQTRGLSPEDAYVLSSLTVDLKIAEIVNGGQHVVTALLPL